MEELDPVTNEDSVDVVSKMKHTFTDDLLFELARHPPALGLLLDFLVHHMFQVMAQTTNPNRDYYIAVVRLEDAVLRLNRVVAIQEKRESDSIISSEMDEHTRVKKSDADLL